MQKNTALHNRFPDIFDPRDFGALPDGRALCTSAIQQAIDACAAAGGGTVRLAGGTFLSGTIRLRSHVILEITGGTTLLGSPNLADYPEFPGSVACSLYGQATRSLILGENIEHAGLIGRGVIDGQGHSFQMEPSPDGNRNRPYVIRMTACRDILVEGLHLRNSGMWMQHYLACERLTMRGVRVYNFCNYNNDSLDLDGCRDCLVTQCVFESNDDAITLKSGNERPTMNVAISDCIARSNCNALKFGTESNGGFRNIAITNCVITSPSADLWQSLSKTIPVCLNSDGAPIYYGSERGISGITLAIVDGGILENVTISNIVIEGVEAPLFLRLGNRARPISPDQPPNGVGIFRNVNISHIIAGGVGRSGSIITGLPGAHIENVRLSDIQIHSEGGGMLELANRKIPECEKHYPEANRFGELPGYGLYCRHVDGLRISGITLRTATADLRPALAFDDVVDLVVSGLDAKLVPGGAPLVQLSDSCSLAARNTGIPEALQ